MLIQQLVMISATFALVSVRKTNMYQVYDCKSYFIVLVQKLYSPEKLYTNLSKNCCTRKLLQDNFFLKQILHVNKINFDTFLALYFTVLTYIRPNFLTNFNILRNLAYIIFALGLCCWSYSCCFQNKGLRRALVNKGDKNFQKC